MQCQSDIFNLAVFYTDNLSGNYTHFHLTQIDQHANGSVSRDHQIPANTILD